MKKFLLLGGTGFIGLYLAKELLKDSHHQVTILGRSAVPFTNELMQSHPNFLFLQKDVAQLDLQDRTILDVDVVYYLVSGSFPGKTWDQGQEELDVNLRPFFQFFSLIGQCELRPRVVFISSGGTVYGRAPLPNHAGYKEDSPTLPYVPYGIFKLTQEHLLSYFLEKNGIPFQIARVGNVYGPNLSAGKLFGVINIWVEHILDNEPIILYGSGTIVRDYIFIEDLVHRLIYLGQCHEENEIFNVSTGVHASLRHILTVLGCPDDHITILAPRKSDVERVVLDGSKLEKLCKLDSTSLEAGINWTLEFEKEKKSGIKFSHGKA